jgi:hypothetical protein
LSRKTLAKSSKRKETLMKILDIIRFWKRNRTCEPLAGSPPASTGQIKLSGEKLRDVNGDELSDEKLKQVAGGLNPQPIPPGVSDESDTLFGKR